MNFERMKALLLDLAIRGELVSQKPEEGWVDQIGAKPEVMPFAIPESWKWVQLKNVGQIVGGGTPKTSEPDYWNGDISWITPADLGKNSSKWIHKGVKSITRKGLKESSAKLMPSGSVVYSSRAPIGHIAIAGQELCTNQGCKSFVPNDQYITTEWAYYMLIARTKDIQSRASGTTFKEISGKGVGETWITLPSQAEQRRIVAKLEEAFVEIDRAEKAYEELQTLAGVLRGQILQEAIQGKLVPQLAEEGVVEQIGAAPEKVPFTIPESWKWTTLNAIGKWKAGGTPSRSIPEYYGGEIPWLKTGDLTDGLITTVEEYITRAGVENSSAHINPAGAVLIAMYGATIGKLGVLAMPCATNQACCACAVNEELVDKSYLFYYLLSQRTGFLQLGAGGAQPNISKTKIVNYPIPVPPLKEQRRIVAAIEELLKQVNALSAR